MTATDAPLRRLAAILDEEAEALRRLDMAGIDRAAHDKEALEPELAKILRGAVTPDDAKLIATLRVRARENQRRLAASLSSVRGLVRALVSDDTPSYGRNVPPPTVRSILTSVIG